MGKEIGKNICLQKNIHFIKVFSHFSVHVYFGKTLNRALIYQECNLTISKTELLNWPFFCRTKIYQNLPNYYIYVCVCVCVFQLLLLLSERAMS